MSDTPRIVPALADDALLADIDNTLARSAAGELHVWWLGQSGFLASCGNDRIVFDPYLSDLLTRKYANTDKPHVRLSERVIAPERLTGVTAVTSTHNHTDHLDAETLLPLFAANPDARLVLPAANVAFAASRLGWPIDDPRFAAIDAGGSVDMAPDVRFFAVPAAHEALDVDEQGRHVYLGFVAQLGGWTIYHSGDTVRYNTMVERLAPFSIDVALLPINGRSPERRVSGNLWGDEAAQLACDIGAGVVIPCHYDLFAFNTASPDTFEAACHRLNQPFSTLKLGERLTLPRKTAGL